MSDHHEDVARPMLGSWTGDSFGPLAEGRFRVSKDLHTRLKMKWSNHPPTEPVTILDGISREMWAFCDIVSLCDPANQYQRRPAGMPAHPAPITVGQLQLEFDLPDEWQLLAPGTYQLTLRIGAANAAPICKVLEFTHDGRWTPDDPAMRRDYLDVSLS